MKKWWGKTGKRNNRSESTTISEDKGVNYERGGKDVDLFEEADYSSRPST